MLGSADPRATSRTVVLVVDDDADDRYLLVAMLKSRGYQVIEACNGLEALELASSTPIDAVITDVLMPGMDGYQLCREWAEDDSLESVAFLFYSSSTDGPGDERAALELGADAFMIKPRLTDDIAAEIERARARRRGRRRRRVESVPQDHQPYELKLLREHNERLVTKLENKLVELRRTSAQLDRERDFSNRVTETPDMLIIGMDAEGRITLFSRGAEEITGFSPLEVVGERFIDVLVAPEDRAAQEERLDDLVRDPRTQRWTWHARRRDLGMRWVEWTCAPTCDERGEVDGFLGLGLDVTERRRLEQAKADFIAAVGHELRTPLTTVIGYGDILATILGVELRGRRTGDVVSGIRNNAERMRLLVEQLLEVTEMQTEGLHLLKRFAPVSEVLRYAEEVPLTKLHRLVVLADEDLPLLLCDPVRLGSALERLVDNAVKYSPDGGVVEVRARRDASGLAISVRDQGVGISQDTMSDIFDWFSQADMSSTRRFGGLGLGLFVAREVVRAHGGRILVDSTPGEGSVFTLLLPGDAA